MREFCFTLTALLLLALPVFGQSSLTPAYGYNVTTWLPDFPNVGAFDFSDTLFFLNDGDTIHMLGINSGVELKKFGEPEDYTDNFVSFLTLSPDGLKIWTGYTTYGSIDDRIYSIDVESGEWEHQATFPGNWDLVFWKDSILVSGLNSSSWDAPAAVFVLDTTGANNHRRIIEPGGYSAGMALDEQNNLYYGTSYAMDPNALYRWHVDTLQARMEDPEASVLHISDGEKLSDLPAGVYDCEVDEGGNVLFNMNLDGGLKVVCKWNEIAGDGQHIDTLATASGEWDWLGNIKSKGNIALTEPGNMIITHSFGQPLAMLTHNDTGAQFIAELMEYAPAPGQLINVAPWGTPDGARSIEGSIYGTVSLGAFGGYVIFRFEHPVENDPQNPFGVDFTIFGNPMPDWSEPGVVWVMKDDNANGEADDTWYELAGSDYWFSSTRKRYRVKYYNPGGSVAADVPWEDPWGGQGVIRANSQYTQPYYPLHDSFPGIDADSYELEGTLLQGLVFEHPTGIKSIQRAFGYADNQLRGSESFTVPDNPYTRNPENSGGDAFDIGWAVDSGGNYVELDLIHFIKVQSGLLADGGRLGELSTELTGAVDVPPDPAISGESDMVVIRDLPPLLELNEYQLEVRVFQHGRNNPDETVLWTTSHSGATVDNDHILRVTDEGPLSLTASLSGRPEISATVSTNVSLNQTNKGESLVSGDEPIIYPNPTSGYFRIRSCNNATLSLYDASGKELIRVEDYVEDAIIDISTFPKGIYMVRVVRGDSLEWLKVLKQ